MPPLDPSFSQQWNQAVRKVGDDAVETARESSGEKIACSCFAASTRFSRFHKLLQELENRLTGDHAFTVYAANSQERSVNFGIVVTYRQMWEPVSYQVGRLVKSIPLAPKAGKQRVLGSNAGFPTNYRIGY